MSWLLWLSHGVAYIGLSIAEKGRFYELLMLENSNRPFSNIIYSVMRKLGSRFGFYYSEYGFLQRGHLPVYRHVCDVQAVNWKNYPIFFKKM